MTRPRAFTLIELLVVISIIVLLLALLLPALMGARRSARQQENATRMKSLAEGMKRLADGNNGNFPGLDSQGKTLPDSVVALYGGTGTNLVGNIPVARLAILFEGNFAQPDDAINPIDSAVEPYRPGAGAFGTLVQPKNLSYAMIQFDDTAPPGTIQYGRKLAWSSDVTVRAPLIVDRNTGGDANRGSRVSSVWEEFDRGTWTGDVVRGDLSVLYENTHTLECQYPGGLLRADDNMFTRVSWDDAAMVYKTAFDYVAQRP